MSISLHSNFIVVVDHVYLTIGVCVCLSRPCPSVFRWRVVPLDSEGLAMLSLDHCKSSWMLSHSVERYAFVHWIGGGGGELKISSDSDAMLRLHS